MLLQSVVFERALLRVEDNLQRFPQVAFVEVYLGDALLQLAVWLGLLTAKVDLLLPAPAALGLQLQLVTTHSHMLRNRGGLETSLY
jgi:hypothetical protein